jgi:hypothetical protein
VITHLPLMGRAGTPFGKLRTQGGVHPKITPTRSLAATSPIKGEV